MACPSLISCRSRTAVPATGDTNPRPAEKPDRIALLHGGCLVFLVIGCSTDDDCLDPLEDFLPLLAWTVVEVARETPCEPSAFGWGNILQVMPCGRSGRVRGLREEIPIRRPVATFNPAKNFMADDPPFCLRGRPRRLDVRLVPCPSSFDLEAAVMSGFRGLPLPGRRSERSATARDTASKIGLICFCAALSSAISTERRSAIAARSSWLPR